MKFLTLLTTFFFIALATVATLPAQQLFNLDFEGSQHVIGQTPAVGGSVDNPSRINFGYPTVVTETPGFSGKLLKFTGYVSYEQIQLDANRTNQRFVLSFDLETENLRSSQYAFTILFDAPNVHTFSLHGGLNQFSLFQSALPSGNLGQFVDGHVYHIELAFDLLTDRYTVDIDGVRAFSDTHGGATILRSIRFSLAPSIGGATTNTNVRVFLDNVALTASDVGVLSPISRQTVIPPGVPPVVVPPLDPPVTIIPPVEAPVPVSHGIIVKSSSLRQGTTSASRLVTEGTYLRVTAFPKAGYRFFKWKEGNATISRKRIYVFKVERSRRLVAYFIKE